MILLFGGKNRTCKECGFDIKGISVLGRTFRYEKNSHLSKNEEFSNKIEELKYREDTIYFYMEFFHW